MELNAGFFRSASAFMNILLATLKILADYYPTRLHKAFVIDPPSLFSYLWKVKTISIISSLNKFLKRVNVDPQLIGLIKVKMSFIMESICRD